jgi:hypothetical protein
MDLNDICTQDRSMFAPYCTTHGSQVLLGYESIVQVIGTTPPHIVLRCYCGTLVDSDAVRPELAISA